LEQIGETVMCDPLQEVVARLVHLLIMRTVMATLIANSRGIPSVLQDSLGMRLDQILLIHLQ
jgi:hypothetical protein